MSNSADTQLTDPNLDYELGLRAGLDGAMPLGTESSVWFLGHETGTLIREGAEKEQTHG